MVSRAMKYVTATTYRWALGWGRQPSGIRSYFYQKVGRWLEVRLAELGLGWVVCGEWSYWVKVET